MGTWKFLTNHVHVLACIAAEPGIRLRDIAVRVDITERAAHRIVSELEEEGCLTRHKVGARNFYEVHPERPLRHAPRPELTIGDLLHLLLEQRTPAASSPGAQSDTS